MDKLAVNFVAGTTVSSYTHTNFFRRAEAGEMSDEAGHYVAENKNLLGAQIKGGASYEINDNTRAFVNLGWVKGAPTFDKAINDETGDVYTQSLANL